MPEGRRGGNCGDSIIPAAAGASSPDVDELLDVDLFDAHQLAGLAREGEVDLKTLAGLALAGVALGSADG